MIGSTGRFVDLPVGETDRALIHEEAKSLLLGAMLRVEIQCTYEDLTV